VEDVVVGAMSVNNAKNFFKPGVLLITPGDREDLVLAAAAGSSAQNPQPSTSTASPLSTLNHQPSTPLAGIVLTGNLRPSSAVLRAISAMPFPVLFSAEDSYEVASRVHDLIVKIRPSDAAKISLIRDLIAKNVNLKKILESL
jgi:BioD-like phosphotransacetylase family protein